MSDKQPFYFTDWARVTPIGFAKDDSEIVLVCAVCREHEPTKEWIFACSELCFRNALIRLKPETLELVVQELKAFVGDTSNLTAGEILAMRQDLE